MKEWKEWQDKFKSQPAVYCTWYRYEGIEEIGDLYDSKEAAQLEVDWCKRKGKRPPRIGVMHIHSLELARQRWVRPVDPVEVEAP